MEGPQPPPPPPQLTLLLLTIKFTQLRTFEYMHSRWKITPIKGILETQLIVRTTCNMHEQVSVQTLTCCQCATLIGSNSLNPCFRHVLPTRPRCLFVTHLCPLLQLMLNIQRSSNLIKAWCHHSTSLKQINLERGYATAHYVLTKRCCNSVNRPVLLA